jgi:hypothetical protein
MARPGDAAPGLHAEESDGRALGQASHLPAERPVSYRALLVPVEAWCEIPACRAAVRVPARLSPIVQSILRLMQKSSPPPLLPLLRSRLQAAG